MNYSSIAKILLLLISSVLTDTEDRTLFNFENPDAAKPWQTVNDGVMGGLRGVSRATTNSNSIHSSVLVLKARVRGDGREYNFNTLNTSPSVLPNLIQSTSSLNGPLQLEWSGLCRAVP